VRFPYKPGDTKIEASATKVADLPGGPLNHHWTKGLVASADGSKLYVSVGSNSNVAERGMEHEKGRAAIWVFDRASGKGQIYASGLRNPVGMAWHGKTLWTSVNERDELGSDLVPDYMTSVREGGFYGWPYSYYGQHVDERVQPPRPDLVAKAIKPDYALGSHSASLGLASAEGNKLGGPFAQNGMFVGQHGSWNRNPPNGYKVIFVPFSGDKPSGQPVDVLTGFIGPEGDALGRPVGVAIDKHGALLVADDVGNKVWRVRSASKMVRGRASRKSARALASVRANTCCTRESSRLDAGRSVPHSGARSPTNESFPRRARRRVPKEALHARARGVAFTSVAATGTADSRIARVVRRNGRLSLPRSAHRSRHNAVCGNESPRASASGGDAEHSARRFDGERGLAFRVCYGR
jgi:hypothetical protein